MHNIVKSGIAVTLCALLTGCGGVRINYTDKSYTTDSVTVKAQIPQFCGICTKELEEKINNDYVSIMNELLRNFEKSAKETGEQSVFETETFEHCNSGNFLSVVTQADYYVRKNHKNSFRITKNIDNVKGFELSLCDLFSDDGYIDAINSIIDEEISQNPDKYKDLWAKPRLSQNQRFYIDGENLVIFYPPYELSYYERGFVEIPIKLEDIRGYLKEEYRF